MLTDYPECNYNNGRCQHKCYNTYGSYYCACHTGYKLLFDKHGCIGMYINDIHSYIIIPLNHLTDRVSDMDIVWLHAYVLYMN